MLHGIGKGDVRALHRTRVATRRLRELLPVLQIENKQADDLGRRLRKVTRRLGKVRERDVLLLLIESLKETGRYDRKSLTLIGSAIAQERAAARERLMAKLSLRDLRRLSVKLDKLAKELADADAQAARSQSARRALRWAVEARVLRRGSALKSAIEAAGPVYLPDRLHSVRIALKKFRYAVELVSETAGDQRLAAPLLALKRNQDLLGRWHDLQILIDRVRQLQASVAPPDVGVWRSLNGLMTTLEHECRRLHARYIHESAALLAVCDRLTARSPAAARQVG